MNEGMGESGEEVFWGRGNLGGGEEWGWKGVGWDAMGQVELSSGGSRVLGWATWTNIKALDSLTT